MAAYLIARIDVTDAERYEDYKRLAPAAIEAHGGRYLVRGGVHETIEGEPEDRRIVVLEFEDAAAARAFYHSPEYTAARSVREGAATGQFVIVEGV